MKFLHAERFRLSGSNLPIGHSIRARISQAAKMELKDTLQVHTTTAHRNTSESTITVIVIR
jgi:hypothetical protein